MVLIELFYEMRASIRENHELAWCEKLVFIFMLATLYLLIHNSFLNE